MKRSGYTFIELLAILILIIDEVATVALTGGVVYTAIHFISKVW